MQRQAENLVQPGRWSITATVVVWTLLIGGGLLQILQEALLRDAGFARVRTWTDRAEWFAVMLACG